MRVLLRIAAVIVLTGAVVLLVARGQELWLVAGLLAGVVVAAVVGRRQRRLEEEAEPVELAEPVAEFEGDGDVVAGYPEYADAPGEPQTVEPDVRREPEGGWRPEDRWEPDARPASENGPVTELEAEPDPEPEPEAELEAEPDPGEDPRRDNPGS